jgi:hypothetical protein
MEVSNQLHAQVALLPIDAPNNHWIRGWVGAQNLSRRGSEDEESNPGSLTQSQLLYRYELSRLML